MMIMMMMLMLLMIMRIMLLLLLLVMVVVMMMMTMTMMTPQAAKTLLSSGPQALDTLSVEDVMILLGLLDPPPREGYPVFTPEHASLMARLLTPDLFKLLADKETSRRSLALDDVIQAGVDSPATPIGETRGMDQGTGE
jgi:hypothetical protein